MSLNAVGVFSILAGRLRPGFVSRPFRSSTLGLGCFASRGPFAGGGVLARSQPVLGPVLCLETGRCWLADECG